jgi:hypothetical protein
MQMLASKPFDRATLEKAFDELGRRALTAGRVIELAVYGGCAVMLTLDHRAATKDVDAVFEKDKEFVRKIAEEMAREHGWDRNWLNDGVKGFLSASDNDPAAKTLFATYPSEENSGLRVFVAKPQYLFAMKCRAMRSAGAAQSQDIEDIRLLAGAIGISSAEEAMDLVQAFYPRHLIEPKTQFGLEEIFAHLRDHDASGSGPS